MLAWLVYDRQDAERNREYINFYFDGCKSRGIELELLISDEVLFCVEDGKATVKSASDGKILRIPDFAVCRVPDANVTAHLEAMGIPTFNNSFVSRICNDKMKTYEYLASNGIKIPDTCYLRGKSKPFDYPFVIKPVGGRGGKNVLMVKNDAEFEEALKIEGESLCVAQKVVSDVGKDVRVYVIGKEIICACLRSSDKDFRSNFCLGGKASLYELNREERETVMKICGLFDFGMVGIDFIFDGGRAIFNEIEDVVGARMVYSLTNINIVSKYLDYIIGKIKKN